MSPIESSKRLEKAPKRFYVSELPNNWDGPLEEKINRLFDAFTELCVIDELAVKQMPTSDEHYGIIDVLRRKDGERVVGALTAGNRYFVKSAECFVKVQTESPVFRLAYSKEQMLAIRDKELHLKKEEKERKKKAKSKKRSEPHPSSPIESKPE